MTTLTSPQQPRSQSAYGRMLSDLNVLYRVHLNRRAARGGDVGMKTRRERRVVLERTLRDLHKSGLELRRLKNLRGKHVEQILTVWRERKLLPSTFATYASHLRTLCRWLQKPQLVELIDRTLAVEPTLVRRRGATDHDRSEKGAGIDFKLIFERALRLNERFACQLALVAAFGLRSQEAWLFRPHLADLGQGQIRIAWGTKGGRPRVLPIPMTREQQAVLEWAKTFAASPAESMIPRGLRLERWRWRYYRMCRQIGLTRRALMVTPHSLRHGVLLDIYEQLLGQPAPARGGEAGELHPAAIDAVRQVVAEYAGHSRPQISSAYLGPLRRIP